MEQAPATPLTLHCLVGREAPPGLGEDLRRLLEMPPAARANLWRALGPSLAEPIPADTERLLDTFSSAFQVAGADIARAIKACRFLIRGAAAIDLERERLAEDLDALGAGAELREILLAGYDPARVQVRTEMLRGTLTDHGNLLVGVDWRIDAIDVSSRGSRLSQPVAMLTLRYRRGSKARRVTVQVLPDVLRELQQICETILS